MNTMLLKTMFYSLASPRFEPRSRSPSRRRDWRACTYAAPVVKSCESWQFVAYERFERTHKCPAKGSRNSKSEEPTRGFDELINGELARPRKEIRRPRFAKVALFPRGQ